MESSSVEVRRVLSLRSLQCVVIVALCLLAPSVARAEVVYVGAGALGAATLTTNPNAAVPTGTIVNDILIVDAWTRSTADTTTVSGYTEFAQIDTGTGSHRWFWRRADGTEATVACVHDQSADSYCRMFAFRGVVTSGNPWNTLGTAEADTSNTDPTSHTGITTGAANSMVVILMGYEDNDAAAGGTISGTDPSSLTEVYTESSTGADGAVIMGYALKASAGGTGTISYDYGGVAARSDDEASIVLSLDPEVITGPQYVCAGALGAATTITDATAAVPTCAQADDVLIIHAWTRSTADTTTITGYTEFAQIDTSAGSHRWFWKRHSGSESTATCDHDQSADNYCRMFAFRGVITTGDPWNALGTPEVDNGTGDPTSHTGITTGSANSLVVVFIGEQDNDSTTVGAMTGTDPASYVVDWMTSATGSDGSIGIGAARRSDAGSTGTISYNYGTISSRTAAGDEGSLVLSLAPPSTDTGVVYRHWRFLIFGTLLLLHGTWLIN